MQGAYLEVTDVLSTYFDGLYHRDTKRLRSVFHPRAQYVCASDGTLTYRTMEEYFPVVDQRPSPASRGEPRADSIVSIEFAGPVTAFARVHCAIRPKYFTDLLTLIRVDSRWQIISKVFHFDIRETRARDVTERAMPYVNIKITREGAKAEQKSALIKGVTDLLANILGKDPATTFVVIDEVGMEDWGVGDLPLEEYRRKLRERA
jgi:4-oxalocrotonate tautomerase family enzyme